MSLALVSYLPGETSPRVHEIVAAEKPINKRARKFLRKQGLCAEIANSAEQALTFPVDTYCVLPTGAVYLVTSVSGWVSYSTVLVHYKNFEYITSDESKHEHMQFYAEQVARTKSIFEHEIDVLKAQVVALININEAMNVALDDSKNRALRQTALLSKSFEHRQLLQIRIDEIKTKLRIAKTRPQQPLPDVTAPETAVVTETTDAVASIQDGSRNVYGDADYGYQPVEETVEITLPPLFVAFPLERSVDAAESCIEALQDFDRSKLKSRRQRDEIIAVQKNQKRERRNDFNQNYSQRTIISQKKKTTK